MELAVAIAFVCLYLPLSFSANIKNNACSKVEFYHFAAISPNCRYNPDVLSTLPEMVERHGYSFDNYSVTTDDGYVLNIFKIWSENADPSKLPVFVQHGIAVNSGSWTDVGNRSMAFRLADQGYEVYVGNLRGSIYANQHETLSINNPKYWNYDIDTVTDKDIRTQLNFVYNLTNKKMLYVGHSMGTTVSFMYSSEYSEEASRLLQGIIALAPVAYLNHVAILEIIRPFAIPLADTLSLLQVKGLFYHENLIHRVLTSLCKNWIPDACYLFLSVISGETKQFLPDDLLIFWTVWPSGTSVYQLKHYLQIAYSENFQKYDFGILNKNKYGSLAPPLYNLSEIQVPICLLYGENDILYKQENLERLYNEIGSPNKCKYSIKTEDGDGYAHIDFLFAKNIEDELYQKMFDILESQSMSN